MSGEPPFRTGSSGIPVETGLFRRSGEGFLCDRDRHPSVSCPFPDRGGRAFSAVPDPGAIFRRVDSHAPSPFCPVIGSFSRCAGFRGNFPDRAHPPACCRGSPIAVGPLVDGTSDGGMLGSGADPIPSGQGKRSLLSGAGLVQPYGMVDSGCRGTCGDGNAGRATGLRRSWLCFSGQMKNMGLDSFRSICAARRKSFIVMLSINETSWEDSF